MLGRLFLVLALGFAVGQGPLLAATARCCDGMDSQQTSLLDGCCAPTACCAISPDVAQQPTTPAPLIGQVAVVPAIIDVVSLISFPASAREHRFAHSPPVANSPPSLALLCTRLV